MLPMFINLDRDQPFETTLCIMHFDDPMRYILTEKDILVMIQAGKAHIEHGHKRAPSHATVFHRVSRALPSELYARYLEEI